MATLKNDFIGQRLAIFRIFFIPVGATVMIFSLHNILGLLVLHF